MWIKAFILIVLTMIFVQDIRSRSVYWFMFPLLATALLLYRFTAQGFAEIWPAVLVNLAFVVIQLVLITAWFSLRQKKWISIADSLLGWGDILFLFSVAVALPVFTFLAFYIGSLAVVSIGWALIKTVLKNQREQIPLAGLQALLLGLVFLADWYVLHCNLINDNWVLKMISI